MDRNKAHAAGAGSIRANEHSWRQPAWSHSCPVAAFGYSLQDDQIMDLRAAGIGVFQHGLCPEVFAWIADQLSDGLFDGLV
jgi:hypothetical protein